MGQVCKTDFLGLLLGRLLATERVKCTSPNFLGLYRSFIPKDPKPVLNMLLQAQPAGSPVLLDSKLPS